jgi:fatty-acyl-CoA synthase
MLDEPGTLSDLLRQRAAADPARLAYDDGRRAISYRELASRADGVASGLSRLGVRTGDRVALVMSAGVPFAEVFWGVQLLGAVPCALSPAAPQAALARRAAQVRPSLVVDDEVAASLPHGDGVPDGPTVGPEDLAFMQLTSGTSGEPRAAMVRHRNVLSFLRSASDLGYTRRDDIFVSWVPPWHDLGLVRFLIGGVYDSAPCHIVEPAIRTIPHWLETIGRVGGTVTGAPDFAYRLATRMVDPQAVDLSSLRFTISGGEPLRRSTIEAFEEHFGVPGVVLPGYGLAEATLAVTTHEPGDALAVDARGNVSSGRVLPGLELRIDGDATAPGEILVRGDFVFAGYFEAPDDTEAALRDGWLHTGDTGYQDADGLVYVLGRQRAMIKRGGAVVAPRELEEAAHGATGVRLAAAVGVPDEVTSSERITVVVEADASAERPARAIAADVHRAIAETAGFAPAQVTVVPPRTIPLTANGKVRHDRLRAALADGLIG